MPDVRSPDRLPGDSVPKIGATPSPPPLWAKASAHLNRQLQVLSSLTALFLPATLVTGLFGMNTHGLPFGGSGTGFWWATVVAAMGSGAVYLVLRRMGIMK